MKNKISILFLLIHLMTLPDNLFAQSTTTQPVSGNSSTGLNSICIKLTRTLSFGSTGADVTSLQNYLKSKGHLAVNSTGYYGVLTQDAVEKFQKSEGIVLSGTPETTGLGMVGPTTRSIIEKLSCVENPETSKNNDFFGYNLDELFNQKVNIDYDIDFNTNIPFDTKIEFNTDIDFSEYEIDDFDEIDFEDFDFDFDEIEFSNNVSGYDNRIKDNVGVLVYAKAVNGEFVRGGNNIIAVATSTNVDLLWESSNVKNCVLTGDFKEKRLSVPVEGGAKLKMLNPTGGRATNGDPVYQFTVNCSASTTNPYALPAGDKIKLWVYRQ